MDIPTYRPILKNNAALLVQYGAGALVPLVLIPHMARTVGLEAYGALAVLLAWAGWGSTAVAYAFQLTGPARAASGGPAREPALVATILAARTVLLFLVVPVLLAAYAAGLMPRAPVAAVALILIGLPAASALNASWHLQVHHRFAQPALLSTLGTAMAVALGWFMVTGPQPASVGWVAAALVCGALTVAVGTLALSRRLTGPLPRVSRQDVRQALDEGRPLFASQVAAIAYSESGPILIAWLTNLQQAGAYGVIERLLIAVSGALLLVNAAAYPTLARLYGTDRRSYLKLAGFVTFAYLAAAGAIAMAAWVFREPVLAYLYGAAGPRPYALYLLGLVWMASAIFGTVVTGYYVVSGRGREVYPLTLKVLALSLALGIPGILLYGAAGWMAGLVAGQALVVVAALQEWKKEHDGPRE